MAGFDRDLDLERQHLERITSELAQAVQTREGLERAVSQFILGITCSSIKPGGQLRKALEVVGSVWRKLREGSELTDVDWKELSTALEPLIGKTYQLYWDVSPFPEPK